MFIRRTASTGAQEYSIKITSLNNWRRLLWCTIVARHCYGPGAYVSLQLVRLLVCFILSPPLLSFHSVPIQETSLRHSPAFPRRSYLPQTTSLESLQASSTTHAGWWSASSSLHDPAFLVLSPSFTRIRQTIAPCRQHLVSPEESTDGSTASRMKVAIRATPLSHGAVLLARMSHAATPSA